MAVPFRRTSKTAKRKRRTHQKLEVPGISVEALSGEYKMSHRINKKTGMYKGRVVVEPKN